MMGSMDHADHSGGEFDGGQAVRNETPQLFFTASVTIFRDAPEGCGSHWRCRSSGCVSGTNDHRPRAARPPLPAGRLAIMRAMSAPSYRMRTWKLTVPVSP